MSMKSVVNVLAECRSILDWWHESDERDDRAASFCSWESVSDGIVTAICAHPSVRIRERLAEMFRVSDRMPTCELPADVCARIAAGEAYVEDRVVFADLDYMPYDGYDFTTGTLVSATGREMFMFGDWIIEYTGVMV